MRFILCRAELLDLKLSCFRAQTRSVCLHPSNHPVFPLPDCENLNRSKRSRLIQFLHSEEVIENAIPIRAFIPALMSAD